MIILIAKENTTDDPIIFHDDSVLTNFPMGEARASNVKLVTGGTYFHNQGYYHAGREATFSARLTDAQTWQLRNWHESQDEIYFTTNYEHFSARVKSCDIEVFPVSFTLEILSLDADADDIIYPPPAPSEEWVDLTSNTYWSADTGSWSGSQWESDSTDLELSVSGAWATGFDPSAVRITFTVDGGQDIMIFDLAYSGTGYEIASAFGTSPKEVTLTRGDNIPASGDITDLRLYTDPPYGFVITKIEFYGIDPT